MRGEERRELGHRRKRSEPASRGGADVAQTLQQRNQASASPVFSLPKSLQLSRVR